VNTLQTRLDVLEAIQYIDFIVVFEEDTPSQVLESLHPDILVKGGDYAVESIVGREFAGETRVCSFVEGVSSTATIQRIQGIQGLSSSYESSKESS
jgi:D-beta-D-heptose 7-phosphate kinase/D-beta-D-heptose 1-phosphate adenosyltransferase